MKQYKGELKYKDRNEVHAKFGTYFYGNMDDGAFFIHRDGSAGDPRV